MTRVMIRFHVKVSAGSPITFAHLMSAKRPRLRRLATPCLECTCRQYAELHIEPRQRRCPEL